jgi:ribosomal protein S7
VTGSLGKLKKLKRRYKAAKKGYRASQYEILAEAMAEVVRLRADEEELEVFIRTAEVERPAVETRRRSWITFAAVSFVTSIGGEPTTYRATWRFGLST